MVRFHVERQLVVLEILRTAPTGRVQPGLAIYVGKWDDYFKSLRVASSRRVHLVIRIYVEIRVLVLEIVKDCDNKEDLSSDSVLR